MTIPRLAIPAFERCPASRVPAVVAIVLAMALAACASRVPAPPDPADGARFAALEVRPRPRIEDAVAEGVASARRSAALGRRSEAFARLMSVTSAHPGNLECERALQDLLAGTRSDAWLRRRYEDRLRADPAGADANYLAARIEPSRARQAKLFDTALAADPGHPWARLGRAVTLDRRGRPDDAVAAAWRVAMEAPWLDLPWLYLGQTAVARGAPQAAERFLLEAIARGAADARPWTALAAVYDDLDQGPDASRAALEALRRAPGDAATTWGLGRILDRRGTPGDLASAVRVVTEVRAVCDDVSAADALRGRLLVAAGRFDEALSALLDARRGGASPGDIAVPLRRARVGAGRVSEAVREYLGDLPGSATQPDDARAAVWTELTAAADAWIDGDPVSAARLADALDAAGWLDEELDVLRRATLVAPSDDRLTSRLRAAEDFERFLGDVSDLSRDLRRRQRRGEVVPLSSLLDRLRDASVARLGIDATGGARITSYPFIGEFASSDTSDGAFRDVFLRHGLLVVVGARSGRGAELLLGRLVSDRHGRRVTVLGESVVCDEHWLESDGLPDGLAGLRSGMAGLTLDRMVLLQLDVIRRVPPADEPELPYLAVEAVSDPPASAPGDDAPSDDALRSVATPSRVALRIERGVTDRDPSGRLALDAVLRHERVHVLDASRMLPPWRHLFRVLAFAASHGFDGAAVESSLEAHAAVGALLDAEDPRAALASLLAFLPSEAGETAHAAGYHQAVEIAIDEILEDPARFPSIDVRWNVVQQLDRLTPDEVRDLGRRVLRRLD